MGQKEEKSSGMFTVDNYSSTTKLAGSVAGSNESVADKSYNPFDHRSTLHPNTVLGALVHLLKCFLGTGVLAMPNAFKNSGWLFGIFGTLFVGLVCTYSIHLLVTVSQEMCRRARVPVLDYSETAGAVFAYGPKRVRKFSTFAKYFVDCALIATCFLTNCVYVVFIAENLKQLFDYWIPETKFSIYVYMLFIMGPAMLIGQIRELKHLVPLSFIANIFMVTSFGITLYYLFTNLPNPTTRSMFTQFETLPMFFSTVIFAMEGINIVLPVENTMAKPQHFLGCPGVLKTAMAIVVTLYTTIGFFGYIKYGDDVQGSITLSLPTDEIPAQTVKLLIALSVFFSYFLQMFVPVDIIWEKCIEPRVSGTKKQNIAQVIFRTIYVALTIGVSAAVPDLGPIIGLVGALGSSTLGILIPAVMQTVLVWNGGLGAFRWRLILNTLLAVYSIFVLVLGTTQAITELLE